MPKRLKPLALRPFRLVVLSRLSRATHLVPAGGSLEDVLCRYEVKGRRQEWVALTVTREDLKANFEAIYRGLCGQCRKRAERVHPIERSDLVAVEEARRG